MASWASALAMSILGVDNYWEEGQWGLVESTPGIETTDPLPEPAPPCVVSQVRTLRGGLALLPSGPVPWKQDLSCLRVQGLFHQDSLWQSVSLC